MKSVLAIFLFTASVIASVDLDLRRIALENPDLFQGDILGIDAEDRNVIPFKQRRWPKAMVHFQIHRSLSGIRKLIESAMNEISHHTCVSFIPRISPTRKNYLLLHKGKGCNSFVGMQGGQQTLSLGVGCEYKGTILHELLHTLGLFHEHNRSDRDKYIQIFWNNIDRGQWDKLALLPSHMNTLYIDFDYSSIMLYGNTAFSKNGRSVTMKTYNGIRLVEPYYKESLSKSDIYKINQMYDCDSYKYVMP